LVLAELELVTEVTPFLAPQLPQVVDMAQYFLPLDKMVVLVAALPAQT
jgi:hypothetical protein